MNDTNSSPELASTRLEAEKIIETLDHLKARIAARFSDSGIARLSVTVLNVARTTKARVEAIQRPALALRFFIAAALAFIFVSVFFLLLVPTFFLDWNAEFNIVEIALGLEASVNLIILFGGAIWFLVGAENRRKRKLVFAHLHELRSLAHVIDMHQLRKDPNVVLNPQLRTAASPAYSMTEFELARYLDYCAEMLAHVGKLAALYAEATTDTATIEAINDLEALTASLGRKIWQKIMIIGKITDPRGRTA